MITNEQLNFTFHFPIKNDHHNEIFWINKTHSFDHIHYPPFLFQIMNSLLTEVIDKRLQDFLELLLPNAHLIVEITNRTNRKKRKLKI